MNFFLAYIYFIPVILCQQNNIDYQNEDGTEVYDDYVFNPDSNEGSGGGSEINNNNNNQIIDNDDEDYSDFKNGDDTGSGSENNNNLDDVLKGTIMPDLGNKNIGKLKHPGCYTRNKTKLIFLHQ